MNLAFTDQLRSVLQLAQRSARGFNQDFVGTEHLVLGVLDCGICEAGRVMQRGGVDLAELRNRLTEDLPRPTDAPVVTGNLPLSPRVQRAINTALAKAQVL